MLTVCVRILILPLFVSQYRSARRMQQIAPQLKQVQAKFKTDKRKQQEEMMRLFQENKVNPFGSCLPMVFQFPIFIALYYVLRNFAKEQIGGADLAFMWVIPDISTQFRSMGWTAVIVAIIYGGSQLLASRGLDGDDAADQRDGSASSSGCCPCSSWAGCSSTRTSPQASCCTG